MFETSAVKPTSIQCRNQENSINTRGNSQKDFDGVVSLRHVLWNFLSYVNLKSTLFRKLALLPSSGQTIQPIQFGSTGLS
jgi:hypothetical protein